MISLYHSLDLNFMPMKVSVQCVERGELMAELRRRYSNLLDRIPHQVKRFATTFDDYDLQNLQTILPLTMQFI